ncbi:MAG TPA: hypothetical protein VLY21_05990 [Nitrososphaerales archaeon]|nr:hypothetical protein [Nitrososphaerales archaeon]
MNTRIRGLLACAVVLMFLPSMAAAVSTVPAQAAVPRSAPPAVLPRVASASTKGAFAFVSNFETMTLEGWQSIYGTAPEVVASPNYSGEPSLQSTARGGTQVDFANEGFVAGASSLSFQVAMRVRPNSSGFLGLASSQTDFVAVVGVSGGNVVAGADLGSLVVVEPVPTGTAFPNGWVSIIANVYQSSGSWVMQVFVDRTDVQAAQVSVPNAGSYVGAMIDTRAGTAHYTDIIVSTYQLATLIPGYNNMEGYGQGSGLVVKRLPAYYTLTAKMTLDSWSTPQNSILSFQINAMNSTGTDKSTCRGFFQLGVDLNQNGYISPWYVPGINCVPSYFVGRLGIPSPSHTRLVLSIVINPSKGQIVFTIVDSSTSQTFSASIPYDGSAFYGAYTQMEFQPCCAKSPISDYALKGQLFDMRIVTAGGQTQTLPASYMLPFSLDAPPSWDIAYYQNATSGYSETSA